MPDKWNDMDNQFIPVNMPLLDGREKEYLTRCIDEGWISSGGPFVSQFENGFATAVGRKHGIAVCNGTAALEVSLRALEIGADDEVIIPAFCIISLALAVLRVGATPVLVDCDPTTWNITADLVKPKITSKTKAVICVHTYGLPVDMDPLIELCDSKNLFLVEDAAEMIGQTYKNKPCGSFGHITAVSFYANKHITTGEGGMVLTDDPLLNERARSARNLCFSDGVNRFSHNEIGYNFRMTNMQAAVGCAQLERLDEFIQKKRHMGRMYNDLLQDFEPVNLPLPHTDFAENIYWVYGLTLKPGSQIDATEAIHRLAKAKIGARPFFKPMHLQPVFRDMGLFHGERYPVSENLAAYGFYIPSGLALTDSQAKRVARVLREVIP